MTFDVYCSMGNILNTRCTIDELGMGTDGVPLFEIGGYTVPAHEIFHMRNNMAVGDSLVQTGGLARVLNTGSFMNDELGVCVFTRRS